MWMGDKGHGCNHCVTGHPIIYVRSRAGSVSLCLECFLLWFPGRGGDWFEQRHLPFRDHIGDALERALERQQGRL